MVMYNATTSTEVNYCNNDHYDIKSTCNPLFLFINIILKGGWCGIKISSNY